MGGPILVSVRLFLMLFSAHSLSDSVVSGLAPVNYCKAGEGDGKCRNEIPLFANTMTTKESFIPFEYHHFDFCLSDETMSPAESIGQVLVGDRIRPVPYKINFMEDAHCKKVCTKSYRGADPEAQKKLELLREGIAMSYQHNWIMDGIPVSWCYLVDLNGNTNCRTGFPMGMQLSGGWGRNIEHNHYLYNHVDFEITYHSGLDADWGVGFKDNGGRIISVKVEPNTFAHNPLRPDCSSDRWSPLDIPSSLSSDDDFQITYTYSVRFIKNNTVKWSSRWDNILDSMPPKAKIDVIPIHINLMVALFLSGALAIILSWILCRNIMTKTSNIYTVCNQMENGKKRQEESGWKLLHGDVFRPPRCGMMLAAFAGFGSQVFGTTLVTLAFACFGSYSLIDRGGTLMTCAVVVWVLLSSLAGFVSARIYKNFGNERQRTSILLTSMLCPGVVFSVFFSINIVMWYMQSSAAVPVLTLLYLVGLWFGLCVPLTFLGAYFGFKDQVIEHPVKTNDIPRSIPEQSVCSCTHPVTSIVLGGILPFASIYVQLYLVLNSLWSNETYFITYNYMSEFLFLAFVILVITCSETTILLCYFHLCAEDYNWWWRAFLSAGSTSFYFFGFCCYYFITYLNIEDSASICIFFGYTIILTLLCFVLTGAIGFMACFWFVRKTYSVEPSKHFEVDKV
ncbi:endomembrane protein 70 domain-containing protein [Phthorimaea operculella]|nr:endomembrane protein 70 domain-containing protein [Phthorimaea operculella]